MQTIKGIQKFSVSQFEKEMEQVSLDDSTLARLDIYKLQNFWYPV